MSDNENGQSDLRGRMLALAVDFGTRARNTWASMEALDDADHPVDAGELEAASKTWTAAAGLIHSTLGTQDKYSTGRALVRIGLTDLAGLLTREEQLTRRVAEIEAELRERPVRLAPLVDTDRQDIQPLYIAGGSSERLTVGRVWIDRAIAEGARVTFDWSRASGYDEIRPTDDTLFSNAMTDVGGVVGARVFWLLAPAELSEGASTELGIAIASAIQTTTSRRTRVRVVVSGPHARRNIFALLADEIYETHEQAWEALRPRVARVSA